MLVGGADDRPHLLEQRAGAEHVGRPQRMRAHDGPLLVGQRLALGDDLVGDRGHPQVAEPAGGAELGQLGAGEAHGLAQRAHQRLDLALVRGLLGRVAHRLGGRRGRRRGQPRQAGGDERRRDPLALLHRDEGEPQHALLVDHEESVTAPLLAQLAALDEAQRLRRLTARIGQPAGRLRRGQRLRQRRVSGRNDHQLAGGALHQAAQLAQHRGPGIVAGSVLDQRKHSRGSDRRARRSPRADPLPPRSGGRARSVRQAAAASCSSSPVSETSTEWTVVVICPVRSAAWISDVLACSKDASI